MRKRVYSLGRWRTHRCPTRPSTAPLRPHRHLPCPKARQRSSSTCPSACTSPSSARRMAKVSRSPKRSAASCASGSNPHPTLERRSDPGGSRGRFSCSRIGLDMPTLIIEGYKFRFYSSDRNEPPHVHVIRGEKVAKIWLSPVELEYNHGYNQREINDILQLTRDNQARLLEFWHDYFGK